MIWLGSKRGYLSDWVTQCWVHVTGRSVSLTSEPWLTGPIAPTTGIASDYLAGLASGEGLRLHQSDSAAGIVPDFEALRGASFAPSDVHPSVTRFYEETSAYELDAWAGWCGLFRPFGWLLAVLFSRRLDTKRSSWVQTPAEIRKLGGALYCDQRYGRVFVGHNGADSYYSGRGFRSSLRV